MLYKNSLKLIFSNFSLVWKILLWVLIATSLCLGLCYLVALPVINLLNTTGWFLLLRTSYEEFIASYSLTGLVQNLGEVIEVFVKILSVNLSRIWFSIVLFCILITFVFSFVSGFCFMPMCGALYHSMSSNTKTSFMDNFIVYFKKNLKYSLFNLLVNLPLRLLCLYLVCKIIVWSNVLSDDLLFLAPSVACLVYVLLNSARITLTSGWVPAQVAMNMGVFSAFIDGVKSAKRRLINTYSNAVGLLISIVFINMFSLICTFGIGLIISIPFTCVWYATFGMTSYYSSSGLKFYVDSYNIISPKKRELSENVSSLKYFI